MNDRIAVVSGACVGTGLAIAIIYVAAGGPWWAYVLGALLVVGGAAIAIVTAIRAERARLEAIRRGLR